MIDVKKLIAKMLGTCEIVSTIGSMYTQTKSTAITTADINTYSVGASLTIPEAGRYILKGEWSFNTVNSARVIDVDLSTNGTSSASTGDALLARTRIACGTGAWCNIECTAFVAFTAPTTIYVKGSSSVTSTAQNTVVRAIRIK
jgi:hypothetical protein